jgi:acyl-CoA synthetase (AMP-forming)/AMP-acid ligase II
MTSGIIDIDIPACVRGRDAATRFGPRLAFVDGARRWSFAEAWTEVERLASGLLAAGLRPGDRVALWMANRAEMILLSLAIEAAGLVRVPLNARLTTLEAERVLADCEPALVVTDGRREVPGAGRAVTVGDAAWRSLGASARDESGLYRAAPGDICSINYTSGSTGEPKGVMLSHRNWMAVYRNLITDRDIRADDRLVHFGPLSHASGAYVMPWFLAGAASVVSPPELGLDGLLATIERERCTVLTCVPTLLTRLLRHPRIDEFDLRSLRQIGYGGEPMPRHTLADAIGRFGPILVQNYGLTEAMMTCCHLSAAEHLRDGELRHGAIGRPYSHVEVVLRDGDGRPVPAGGIGEVTVRADHVMQGYWKRPQETAKVLRGGWLWTGDLARIDGEGIIWLAGRSKDMLICGGFNIWPQEVEAALAGAPGVREVAVLGVPDPDWGEIPVALVAGDGLEEQALRDWAKPRLGLRTPKRWVLLESLPRTAVGKVDKAALKSALMSDKSDAS